jgi:hypothetical protein
MHIERFLPYLERVQSNGACMISLEQQQNAPNWESANKIHLSFN